MVKPGGYVLALAEPDYGGRIDYPRALERIGLAQTRALIAQGADPLIGRQLAEIFSQAGLQDIKVGLLGGEWQEPPTIEDWKLEWAVIESDIGNTIAENEIQNLKSLDFRSWQTGKRILYVPTFYAVGRVADAQ